VDNSGTVLRDVSGRLTKSLALIPEATNTLGHAAAEMQQAVQGMSQSASSLKDVVGESKGLVGDVIKAQQELTELREDVGHLAARMAELNANFGGWSGTSQGLLKDIKQVVADLKIEVDGFLEQTRLFNKDVAANADATRDALEKAREGLDNSARQLEALLSQQQQTFRGLSRQMADSLREGHQRFLVEVNGRFDQGEGLYEQLDQLRISLDRDAHELQQFGGHMATLSPLLQGHQDLVQTSQGALRQLGHAVAALIEDFERQREFEAQRQQAWQEHLEAQRALDQEREEQRERAWQEHVKATQREVAAEFEKLEELLEPLRRLESLGQLDRLQQSLDRSAGALQKVADRLDRRWEWPWKRRAPRA
jgi:ABC-type transporter Mla subunit MlaD